MSTDLGGVLPEFQGYHRDRKPAGERHIPHFALHPWGHPLEGTLSCAKREGQPHHHDPGRVPGYLESLRVVFPAACGVK